jgi:hypothetical protein
MLMVRGGTKGKSFPDKVKLANYIKKQWKAVYLKNSPLGCFWHGKFKEPDSERIIDIYFQYQMRDKSKIDYVDMAWVEGKTYGSDFRKKTIYMLIEKHNINNDYYNIK